MSSTNYLGFQTLEEVEGKPTRVLNPKDNFFSSQLLDGCYESCQILTTVPSGPCDATNLTFHVEAASEGRMLFPSEMVLALKMRIIDKDGNIPGESADVCPITGFPQAMFRSCSLFLNDVEVTGGDGGAYPLKATMDMILNSTASGKQKYLSYGFNPYNGEGYDTLSTVATDPIQATLMETFEKEIVPPPEGSPAGTKPTITNKRFYNKDGGALFSKLYLDITSCNLPLISGVSMRLQLTRSEPAFVLMCQDGDADTKKYRLEVLEAMLLTPMRKMKDTLALKLEKMLGSLGKLDYFFNRVEVKKLSIGQGLQSWQSENVKFGGLIPPKVAVMLIAESSFEGTFSSNPLESRSKSGDFWEVTDMFFTVNSQPLRPLGTIFAGNTNKQFSRAAFYQLQTVLSGNNPYGAGISYEEFATGSFYFIADLTQDQRGHETDLLHKSLTGTLRLDIRFAKKTTANINCIVLAEYPTLVEVFKSRRVGFNYSVDL